MGVQEACDIVNLRVNSYPAVLIVIMLLEVFEGNDGRCIGSL